MMMNFLSVLALSVVGFSVPTAHATIVLQQGFENTADFQVGVAVPDTGTGSVANVGGFWIVGNPTGTRPTTVGSPVHSGSQAVSVTRSGSVLQGGFSNTGVATDVVEVSTYLYLNSATPGPASSVIFSAANAGDLNKNFIELWVLDDGTVAAYEDDGTNPAGYNFSDGIVIAQDQWVGLKMQIDYSSVVGNVGTYDVLVDSGSGFVTAGSGYKFNPTLFAGAIDSVEFSPQGTSGNVTFVDDVLIEAVPEPGSMALLGVGALLLARRWRI